MNIAPRYITSLLMTAVYLLMVFSPLAPLAMHSKRVAHAVTGQCSGDCRIDGCSAERSAAHTCCCWQNKLKNAAGAEAAGEMHPAVFAKVADGCCPTVEHEDHKGAATSAACEAPRKKQTNPSIGVAPCGSGKLFALWGAEKIQHLPYRFFTAVIQPLEQSHLFAIPDSLTSRYLEPPNPPPKIATLS